MDGKCMGNAWEMSNRSYPILPFWCFEDVWMHKLLRIQRSLECGATLLSDAEYVRQFSHVYWQLVNFRGGLKIAALSPYWKGIEHFELLGPAQSKLLWFQKILWRSVKYMDLFLQTYWTKFGPPLPQPLFNQVPQLVAVLFKMGCWNPMSFRGLKPSFWWSTLQVLMVDIPIIPFLIGKIPMFSIFQFLLQHIFQFWIGLICKLS